MSLLFSKVTITPQSGPVVSINESGHPDKYDLWELLKYEKRYAPVQTPEYHNAAVLVRQYRFRVKDRDWLAERDSFALMDAYDELAQRCGAEPFVRREDVELTGQYELRLDLCDFCRHRGLLTMSDVASCNCCDASEFFAPDAHANEEDNTV